MLMGMSCLQYTGWFAQRLHPRKATHLNFIYQEKRHASNNWALHLVCARGWVDNSLGKHASALEIWGDCVNIDVLKKRTVSLPDKRCLGEGLAKTKPGRVNIPSVNNVNNGR